MRTIQICCWFEKGVKDWIFLQKKISHTECIREIGKVNLNWWFDFRHESISTAPLKKTAHFKSGQKRLKNNHLAFFPGLHLNPWYTRYEIMSWDEIKIGHLCNTYFPIEKQRNPKTFFSPQKCTFVCLLCDIIMHQGLGQDFWS